MNMRAYMGDLPGAGGEIEIFLDGLPVELPLERRSLNAIRSFLETTSLERQRLLCMMRIDGQSLDLALPLNQTGPFSRIEAESIALEDSEILLLKTALEQTIHVRECVEAALTLVLINDSSVARELWWNLALQLKAPIVTLSLLPNELCGPANGGASLKKLRKWQLEQIAAIIREVDVVCANGDTILLSNALENRVLPWLCKLQDLVNLWHETTLAGSRLGIKNRTF
jgi:hypothetical protein